MFMLFIVRADSLSGIFWHKKCGVRYILKRLATNKVWSQFSLHGQSGKRLFGATLLMDVITSEWAMLFIAYIQCFLKIDCY